MGLWENMEDCGGEWRDFREDGEMWERELWDKIRNLQRETNNFVKGVIAGVEGEWWVR